jgi:rubrerythrin
MKASRPEHQRVLRRLLSDEERHQRMFTSLLARLEGAKDTPA